MGQAKGTLSHKLFSVVYFLVEKLFQLISNRVVTGHTRYSCQALQLEHGVLPIQEHKAGLMAGWYS